MPRRHLLLWPTQFRSTPQRLVGLSAGDVEASGSVGVGGSLGARPESSAMAGRSRPTLGSANVPCENV